MSRLEPSMMTNSEKLLSYIESAKAAILDVTDGAIGAGDDPLAFVIACFQSQATKIKELSGKHATVQSKWSHERMCLKDAIFRNERRIKELEETIENKACRFNCRTQKDNEKKIKLLLDATMDDLPNPEFCDLMTMEDWIGCVECGGFIDYDGYGYYSDGEKQFSHINVYPSMLASGKLDRSWSHIVWFNK